MDIAAITLKNFRRFQNASFNFSKGVNVVIGENEAGKSTIMQAILSALFVDVRTRSQKFYDFITKWNASAQSIVEMEFEEEGKKYKLIKNFTDSTATLENLETGKTLSDPNLVQEALERLNPIKSDTIYKATALIKQADIAKIEKPADLSKAIETSISTGSGRSIEEVLKELKKEEGELIRGLKSPAKNPGTIKALEDKLEELKKQHSEVKAHWEEKTGASQKEQSSAGEIREIEEKISIIERMINNQKILDEAEGEMKQIDSQLRQIQEQLLRIEKLTEENTEAERRLSQFKEFLNKDLNTDAENASKLEAQIEAKNKMLENLQQELEKPNAKSPNQAVQLPIIISLLAIALGIVLVVLINLLFSVVSLLGAVMLVWQISQSRDLSQTGSELKQQSSRITQLEISKEADQKALKNILNKYKAPNLKDFYNKKIKAATIREEKNRIEAEIKGVLGTKTFEDLQSLQVEILTKKREIEVNKLTDEVKASKMTAEEYLGKRRELDKLKVERRKLERENVESQVIAEDEMANYELLVKLEEAIENNDQKLSGAKEELQIVGATIQVLNEVKADLSGLIQTQVLEKVEEDLPRLTNNRYKDIRLDGEFHLEAFSQEKNDWVDPIENLSTGTADQIYFVYRLALLKMVEGEKKAPLLLDDIFVTYDRLRSEEAKALLKKEGENRQILLFTHDNDFQDWGNLVNITSVDQNN